MKAGALSLSSPELKIHLNSSESSEPIDVEQKEQLETNSLVEEFMLLANISVAAKIQETFPATAVLRRHSPPPKTNFEALQDLLMKRKGMTLDVTSSGALAKSLDACVVSLSWRFRFVKIESVSRTPSCQSSTLSSGSWLRGVCFPRSTFAQEAYRETRTAITVWPVQSTLISRYVPVVADIQCPLRR